MEEQLQQQSARQAEQEVKNLPAPVSDDSMTIGDRAKYILGTAGATGVGAAALGFGELSFVLAAAGGVVGFVLSDTMRGFILDHAPAPRKARTRRSKLNWWLTGQVAQDGEEDAPETLDQEQDGRVDDVFSQEEAEQPLPFARLAMEDVIAHIPANSYRVYLGRSVLGQGNKARSVNIRAQHLKFIGASQYGKSSMAACILEQIRSSHDLEHALIAILDLEDKTGKLFADDPHIVTFRMAGQDVKMHARSREQVLEYLGYIVQLMDWRYTLTETEVEQMPLLIVYVEEFLALKDYYKRRPSFATTKEAKEQALADYDALIYRISELARRGLKAGIQLLLCAQVDYRDEDLAEALANITAGMSFCVKPSAAQAAGFTGTELLKRNYRDSVKGQAVSEFAGCKDLILAPDYDLKQKLLELERRQGRANDGRTPGTPLAVRANAPFSPRQDDQGESLDEQRRSEHDGMPMNVRTFPATTGTPLPEPMDDTSDERPREYRFTEQEIPLLLAAYRASNNVDKACQALHKSAPRYRQHAKEILAAYNARRA